MGFSGKSGKYTYMVKSGRTPLLKVDKKYVYIRISKMPLNGQKRSRTASEVGRSKTFMTNGPKNLPNRTHGKFTIVSKSKEQLL